MLMPTAIIRGQAVEVGGCCQQTANHRFSLLTADEAVINVVCASEV